MRRIFNRLILTALLTSGAAFAAMKQATTTNASKAKPAFTDVVYDALDVSLKFFERLKQHLSADFEDPAVREDAIKKLKGISEQVDELVAANERLIRHIRAGNEIVTKPDKDLLGDGFQAVDPNLKEISDLLPAVRKNLIDVSRMVPDSDRAVLTPRFNGNQIGGASRALAISNIYDIYNHKRVDREEVLKEAQRASELAYQMSNNIASLITELNTLNANQK